MCLQNIFEECRNLVTFGKCEEFEKFSISLKMCIWVFIRVDKKFLFMEYEDNCIVLQGFLMCGPRGDLMWVAKNGNVYFFIYSNCVHDTTFFLSKSVY